MYWIEENSSQGTNQKTYFADGTSDVASLPVVQPGKNNNEVAIGSKCLVIATGDVYVLGSNNIWAKIGG